MQNISFEERCNSFFKIAVLCSLQENRILWNTSILFHSSSHLSEYKLYRIIMLLGSHFLLQYFFGRDLSSLK